MLKCFEVALIRKVFIPTINTNASYYASFPTYDETIKESFELLNLSPEATYEAVRSAFLHYAKQYHPDSGNSNADIKKFVQVERAFRTLSKHMTGKSSEEVDKIVHDVNHIAPQHRQYLSFEGVGQGTPFQREKEYNRVKAQKAAENVMEHRVMQSMATEKALLKKGVYFSKKVKSKVGIEKLVEDLIQESMAKGEFDNLSGKGKPLKHDSSNPYVDYTTYKINQVLIDNGFQPEWITLNKEIDFEIQSVSAQVIAERKKFGPYPLNVEDQGYWDKLCEKHKEYAQRINNKINKYNLVVPLLNRQKIHFNYTQFCDNTLKNGVHSVFKKGYEKIPPKDIPKMKDVDSNDLMVNFVKALSNLFTFKKDV